MDEMDARCKEYKRLGCHFAKWRMWIKIRPDTGAPSDLAINEGARSLAMYALICQANGIVPIVEPDIDRSGNSWFHTESKDKTHLKWMSY